MSPEYSNSSNLTFKDNFWDPELGNFAGYETILKKIKDGQKSTKEYLDYMKSRIITQETYGKSLQKISKVPAAKSESARVIGGCWQNALNGSEMLAATILKFTGAADALLLQNFEASTKLRERRKKEEEDVKQVQTSLKNAMSKVQTRKRQYESKVKERNQSASQLEQAQQQESKDTSKAQQRLQALKQQVDSAAIALTQAEEQLEEARNIWQQRTTLAYQIFESLEEQRLNGMANLQSLLCQLEKDRISAESVLIDQSIHVTPSDIQEDIVSFVREQSTGQQPPSSIRLSLKQGDSAEGDDDDFDSEPEDATYATVGEIRPSKPAASAVIYRPKPPSVADLKKDVCKLQKKFKTLLPNLKLKDKTPTYSVERSPGTGPISSPEDQQTESDSDEGEEKRNSLYGGLETKQDGSSYDFGDGGEQDVELAAVGAYRASNELMRVIYDYTATHESDLSLKNGDLVRLVRIVSDEWSEITTSAGKAGFFPRGYLEPASS